MRVDRVIPMLRIFSVEKAKEFYVGYLGFHVDWEHRFEPTAPLYMQVSRDGIVLHLTEHYGDATPGSAVFIVMRGLDDLHQEVTARNYPYMRPGIQEVPWRARTMTVTDPFGNRLTFNEYNDPNETI
jgi:catechol 2,3-dioxygenase-like lactoylglutathione lyase family enzyme